ncbi:unnamed protein product [Brugia pahangi]|uniref:Uncharacterized protein n=1 Tax=Brugia pahangi TaxID=6280 RepID=A0A0N4TZT4_BRUPA|nr:unnamed protein product [Brugia pahangi]
MEPQLLSRYSQIIEELFNIIEKASPEMNEDIRGPINEENVSNEFHLELYHLHFYC